MKVGVLMCALMLAASVSQETSVQKAGFAEANRVGEPPQVTFFMFSTSYGNYVISQYGLGEVGTPRRNLQFLLKVGMTGRVKRMYFQEYEGDLLLSFEVGDTGYVRRMNQQTRKMRWLTPVDRSVVDHCVVEGAEVHCGAGDKLTKIDLNKGGLVSSN
ncbi:MAG TPA: hypothetical protein VHQ94_09325 [Pyrinomonadaceae bacterium]|jgi:hypothetical protein|nr:hypothetical protein [Pyrinomonadaceae bacterium]